MIDERQAGLAELGEHGVDVRRLERHVMQARPASRDELRDGPLVLARRPRRAGFDAGALSGISC
jgi:hypothetical protein